MLKSPCIGECRLNKEKICEGCFRTISQISAWTRLSEDERDKIIKELDQRKKDMNEEKQKE